MTVRDQEQDALLIRDLSVTAFPGGIRRPLIDGVNLRVRAGECVGLVGESGSGKSVTTRSALGLFPRRAEVSGSVMVDGQEVVGVDPAVLRDVRRHRAAMIFQDPRASVNPVRRLSDFLTEGMRSQGTSAREAEGRAVELLDAVGIRNPKGVLRQFPHELSGGMLQRIVIAGALATKPRLLLADEATTALDVTTQAEVVGLLREMQAETGTGLVFVTHDLELAAALCDRIYVMYAGRVIEAAPTEKLFSQPQHPYTVGLLGSNPRLSGERTTLTPIAGRPLGLVDAPAGCAFRDRCPIADELCESGVPELRHAAHSDVACLRPGALKAVS